MPCPRRSPDCGDGRVGSGVIEDHHGGIARNGHVIPALRTLERSAVVL